MSTINPLFPRQPVPALEVPTVGGGTWRLADQKAANFTLVVFYRGLHCPICANYLGDLNRKAGDFAERGVEIVVISSDDADRAAEAKEKWGMDKLTVGYGLDLDKAREWGLYISSSRGKTSVGIEEPALFSEPALYLVRPDGTLYFGTVQTMPFARPRFADILQALDFVIKNDYPARGEVVEHASEDVV
ncbi:MAG: AhpC/TSA family protein [Gammaproteobacteria bacterium]|nr:AhpC/TSA family protein [Gammaproteobacteria bacterium]NIR83597.1 AhpC/TSA family protein [Gammaproteobacteria bacterium]NIR91570.1 AhpC/TSA family protein [Gammaproteobacteria bacterium]NIU04759.1 AhpC/TSA family protein [Gammaproteobacteria bacterium]NIV53109.1 redoxin domain-containing protein [Gammaproteobacteria bacterium]